MILAGFQYFLIRMNPPSNSSPVKTFSYSQHLLQQRVIGYDNLPTFSWFPPDSSPNPNMNKNRVIVFD